LADDIRSYVSANRTHAIRTYVLIPPSLPPPFAMDVIINTRCFAHASILIPHFTHRVYYTSR